MTSEPRTLQEKVALCKWKGKILKINFVLDHPNKAGKQIKISKEKKSQVLDGNSWTKFNKNTCRLWKERAHKTIKKIRSKIKPGSSINMKKCSVTNFKIFISQNIN